MLAHARKPVCQSKPPCLSSSPASRLQLERRANDRAFFKQEKARGVRAWKHCPHTLSRLRSRHPTWHTHTTVSRQMPSTREHAVDDVDVPLMMDNDGNMRASERGIVLREFVRRDVRKLMEGLVSIDIRWKKIGDRMAKEIADVIRKCPKVTSLDVQDNFVGCIGCMEISKALSQHKHITSLNLSGNSIADLGAAVLSSMLTVNNSLTHLDLSANKLEQQAMQGIGGGLRGNTTLKTLLLADNFFADEGAIELGWAISYNHTIHTLSIRGNVSARTGVCPRARTAVLGKRFL